MPFDFEYKGRVEAIQLSDIDIAVTSSSVYFQCRECDHYLGGTKCAQGLPIEFPEMRQCAGFEHEIVFHGFYEELPDNAA